MNLIKKIINFFGYKSARLIREENITTKNNFSNEDILIKRYAPWQDDKEFLSLYNQIKNYTLVDVYRLYELYTLIYQLKDVKGDVIEIGSWRGGSASVLAKALQATDNNSKLYCCDTFTGVVNATEKDADYKGGEHSDTSIETVKHLFSSLNISNIIIKQGIFPEETGAAVEDKIFKLCHIDVDVYLSAKQCLEFIWPKLQPFGMVVFDDYGFISCNGITQLVNELSINNCYSLYNINGHSILIKLK